jgi:two-component system sensor histidine kinase QseC
MHEIQRWEDARLVEFCTLTGALDELALVRLAHSYIDARIELGPPSMSAWNGDRLPRDILIDVRGADGRLIARTPALDALGPLPSAPHNDGHPWTQAIRGEVWRIYVAHDAATDRVVRVMEISNTRSDLARNAAWQIVWPVLAALPLLGLLVWFTIGSGMAPLRTLSAAIDARGLQSLDPVGIEHAPTEVRPLVRAIDRLLLKLRQSIYRERAFTSNAAHELKTPLAAIKVQAQVALATDDPAVRQLAMTRVVAGVDRGARLADQLLLLARLDEHERLARVPVGLDRAIEDAVARHAPAAQTKGIEIGVDNAPTPAIRVEPMLIDILLDNLLDNAVKYSARHGHIQLRTQLTEGALSLAVLDDGPGVPPGERAHLTERFYRGNGLQAPGSGLGLSIVERIAHYCDASLTFGTGLNGKGLAVVVSFPMAIG